MKLLNTFIFNIIWPFLLSAQKTVFRLIVSIPVTLTLVPDFTRTSRALQRNLDKLKQLSVEKQQIITTQNDIIEVQYEEGMSVPNVSQH